MFSSLGRIAAPRTRPAADRFLAAAGTSAHRRTFDRQTEKETPDMSTILLIVLVLVLLGALPSWPYSRSWGYGPSGVLGLVLVVVVILALTGRL